MSGNEIDHSEGSVIVLVATLVFEGMFVLFAVGLLVAMALTV